MPKIGAYLIKILQFPGSYLLYASKTHFEGYLRQFSFQSILHRELHFYIQALPQMLNDFTGADKVYIACGYTDLRKGIDGLARLVQQQFALDPFTNTLFLFCGRRRDRIKGLYWEKDGFILLYKRLEQGAYQWPRSESEVKTLTPQQYRWLMEGLQIEQPKAHRPVTGLTAV